MKIKFRRVIQLLSAALCNGYVTGFQEKTIFRGKTKAVCVPVLNCYSCPGATGACPIGSLQAVLGDSNYRVSFYILGMLTLFGIVLGRTVCAFLCPFGLFQELLYKIPVVKVKMPERVDRILRYLKYVILAGFVIIGPMLLTNEFGMGSPYFCKLICPAGTLEGGIPLVLSNPVLRSTVGNLFFWKMTVLVVIIICSMIIYRPFCKYICPLGAFYGLFHRFSFCQIRVEEKSCVGCGMCEKTCRMNVRISQNKDQMECIRCGECKAVCPMNAIKTEIGGKIICTKEKERFKK